MSDFQKKVLDSIEKQKLSPKPAYVFLAKRSVFWGLAILSVLFGAINFATILFVVSDYFTTGWRVLDNIHYYEALIAIPVVWLAFAALFVASATFGLRNTRRGYRVKSSHWAAGVMVASVGLGAILHASSAGLSLHTFLVEHFPTYRAATYVPFDEWSRPDEGRLGGTVVADLGDGKIQITDFGGKIWTVDTAGADVKLDDTIAQEGDIAMTGEQTGPDTFRALTIKEFD
jgi:hypothetical protein